MGCFDPATGELHDLGSVSNDASALEETLQGLPCPRTVVLETGRSSYHMAGLLGSMAEEVWIVDPGEMRRLQHIISKTDRRYAAVLAAQRIGQMKEPDPRLKRLFLSVAFRHGRNPAKIAVARRLLDLVYYLLKKEEDCRVPRARKAAA